VRPTVYFTDHVNLAVEVSHQHVAPRGPNPRTGLVDRADLTKLAFMPGVQLGRGNYARPRVQLVYQAGFLDTAARSFFAPEDTRLGSGRVQHFVGLGAEWWVNTQRITTPDTYPALSGTRRGSRDGR
jgi:hypothetical protein